MRKVMKIGVLLPVAVLLVSGCATKGFVRDMFAKKDVEVDQRFVKVEAQVVKVEGQVEGVNTEVKGVTTQVKSLEGAVADARSRADAAMAKAEGVDVGKHTSALAALWNGTPAAGGR